MSFDKSMCLSTLLQPEATESRLNFTLQLEYRFVAQDKAVLSPSITLCTKSSLPVIVHNFLLSHVHQEVQIVQQLWHVKVLLFLALCVWYVIILWTIMLLSQRLVTYHTYTTRIHTSKSVPYNRPYTNYTHINF